MRELVMLEVGNVLVVLGTCAAVALGAVIYMHVQAGDQQGGFCTAHLGGYSPPGHQLSVGGGLYDIFLNGHTFSPCVGSSCGATFEQFNANDGTFQACVNDTVRYIRGVDQYVRTQGGSARMLNLPNSAISYGIQGKAIVVRVAMHGHAALIVAAPTQGGLQGQSGYIIVVYPLSS
jgi:hypothetical protein